MLDSLFVLSVIICDGESPRHGITLELVFFLFQEDYEVAQLLIKLMKRHIYLRCGKRPCLNMLVN